MTIAQSTTIQAYQLRKGGTRARMAILRMIAADSANNRNEATRLQPGDWRGARHYTLASYQSAYATFSQGMNGSSPVWVAHDGAQFRDERFADECEGGPDHRGWFTMADGEAFKDGTGLCRGIVARLPHGRFIAGYWWGDNGERVYFPDVFTDEADAARAADSHAESFAEDARADDERFAAISVAENDVSDKIDALQYAFPARNVSPRHREKARDAIDALREAREALESATAEYERG